MKKFLGIALLTMILFVSCVSTDVSPMLGSKISEKAEVAEKTVETAVVAVVENVENVDNVDNVKTVVEEVVSNVYEPIAMTYVLGDYKADLFADVGEAEIIYPKQFNDKEVYNAIVSMAKNYQSQLKDVFFKVENGKIYLTYPETYGAKEFALAEEILSKELKKLVTPETPLTIFEKVVETSTSFEPIYLTYVLGDYKATVLADVGHAEIVYPKQFNDKEVYNAIVDMAKDYKSQLKDVYFKVENGKIYLTYPESYGAKEFALAEKVVKEELMALTVPVSSPESAKAVETVVTEVTVATAEEKPTEPVVEAITAPVSPQPVTEKASQPVVESTVATEAEPVVSVPESKGLSVGATVILIIVALLCVVAGVYLLLLRKKN